MSSNSYFSWILREIKNQIYFFDEKLSGCPIRFNHLLHLFGIQKFVFLDFVEANADFYTFLAAYNNG